MARKPNDTNDAPQDETPANDNPHGLTRIDVE